MSRSDRPRTHRRSAATRQREQAFLELLRTAAELERDHARFLRQHGLTPTQYNVLRILRGSEPEALSCREVGRRMVTPVPDVTRLVDRLEVKGLCRRVPGPGDRRVVQVRIASAGLELLAALDQPIDDWLEYALGGMPRNELGGLVDRLERLRRQARERLAGR